MNAQAAAAAAAAAARPLKRALAEREAGDVVDGLRAAHLGVASGNFPRRTFRINFAFCRFLGVSKFSANLRKTTQNLCIDFKHSIGPKLRESPQNFRKQRGQNTQTNPAREVSHLQNSAWAQDRFSAKALSVLHVAPAAVAKHRANLNIALNFG